MMRPPRNIGASMSNPHLTLAREALQRWENSPSTAPGISGLFECHIFCSPLNPSDEIKARFVSSCEGAEIKALCLGLDYEGQGVINVLQSTKYYEQEDSQTPVALMLRDAEKLSTTFEVIRLKLEAMAWNPGVPVTDEEARALPEGHYFEFHLKLDAPVSPENDEILKRLAAELTKELGVKIPFSCNNMGNKNQRFLNVRTYHMGSASSEKLIAQVSESLSQKGFPVAKVIKEFIVFDTNKELDRGWLEF
jgi:hypothetical protein